MNVNRRQPMHPIVEDFDAEDVHQVFDWLWCSGQLSPNDITKLPGLGVVAVVNLAPPTASSAVLGEAALVTGLDMAYIQIPVEWEALTLRQLQQFFGVLDGYQGNKVWLHCKHSVTNDHPIF